MAIWKSHSFLVERRSASLRVLTTVLLGMSTTSLDRLLCLARKSPRPLASVHRGLARFMGWVLYPTGEVMLGMCGIVIVYRISSQLSRGSRIFCSVEAFHPNLATMLTRPNPPKARGSWLRISERAARREEVPDTRLRHDEQSQTDAARSNQQETANSTVTILKHGD